MTTIDWCETHKMEGKCADWERCESVRMRLVPVTSNADDFDRYPPIELEPGWGLPSAGFVGGVVLVFVLVVLEAVITLYLIQGVS